MRFSDPIHSSFQRGNEELLNIERKFRTLIAQMEETRAVLHMLKRNPGVNPKAIEILYIVENQKTANEKLSLFKNLSTGLVKHEMEQLLGDLYSAIADNEKIVKQKEEELSFLRDVLLKACREIESEHLDYSVSCKIRKERELYRLQRNEDKEAWINWLTNRRALHHFRIKDWDKDNPARYMKWIEAIDHEIDRVKNLSDNEIMEDRGIFGQNPYNFG